MTIERARRDGEVVIECDHPGCKEEFRISDAVDFGKGWQSAYNQGWRLKWIGRDVVHGCPAHARKI